MTRQRWLLIMLAVVVVAAAVVLGERPAREQEVSRYSSYDVGPLGLKALYLTVQELGYDAERVRRPLSARSLKRRGVLISLDPLTPVLSTEWEAAKAWVAKGNLAIVSPPGCWLKDMGGAETNPPFDAWPAWPSFAAQGVESLEVLPHYPGPEG